VFYTELQAEHVLYMQDYQKILPRIVLNTICPIALGYQIQRASQDLECCQWDVGRNMFCFYVRNYKKKFQGNLT